MEEQANMQNHGDMQRPSNTNYVENQDTEMPSWKFKSWADEVEEYLCHAYMLINFLEKKTRLVT
jgi:hypothetical protein